MNPFSWNHALLALIVLFACSRFKSHAARAALLTFLAVIGVVFAQYASFKFAAGYIALSFGVLLVGWGFARVIAQTEDKDKSRWLAGIANHVVHEQAKRQKLRRAAPLDVDIAEDSLSQSKAQRREERFDRLEEAVKALSPDHRRVILLARVERLPLHEVAQRMGRTRGATRQLLWRALQELRKVFGETESLHLPPRSLKPEGDADGPA